MKNLPVQIQDIKAHAAFSGENFTDSARHYYLHQFQPRLLELKQSDNQEIRELADMVEFLLDTYNKGF